MGSPRCSKVVEFDEFLPVSKLEVAVEEADAEDGFEVVLFD